MIWKFANFAARLGDSALHRQRQLRQGIRAEEKDEYGGDFHCALKVISVPGSQKEYDEMLESMSEFAMRAKLREKVEEISNEYRLLGALRGHPNVVNCEDQMIIPHENDMGWDIYIRMELLQSLPDYVRETV